MDYARENCIDASVSKVEARTSLIIASSKRLSSWIAKKIPVNAEEMEIIFKKGQWSFNNSLIDVQKLLPDGGVLAQLCFGFVANVLCGRTHKYLMG